MNKNQREGGMRLTGTPGIGRSHEWFTALKEIKDKTDDFGR